MKKFKYFLPIIIAMSLLTGCGGEMDDWPYCDLPDEISQYQNVNIEISKNKSYPKNDDITTSKYVSVTENAAVEIYKMIEHLHVSPKSVDIKFASYIDKVSIEFNNSISDYVFEFYALGITNGYFVFNNETTYEFKGDFVSVITNFLDHNDYFSKA